MYMSCLISLRDDTNCRLFSSKIEQESIKAFVYASNLAIIGYTKKSSEKFEYRYWLWNNNKEKDLLSLSILQKRCNVPNVVMELHSLFFRFCLVISDVFTLVPKYDTEHIYDRINR